MILITGGTGQMGQKLVQKLAAEGQRMRLFCLVEDRVQLESIQGFCQGNIEIITGDIRNSVDLDRALIGIKIVFHLAAVIFATDNENILQEVNARGTENLVKAAEKVGVEHFIYISSISVIYPISNSYSRSKLAGENFVRSSSLKAYTIIRPSLVYSEKGGEEFLRFKNYILKARIIFLPLDGKAIKRPIHLDDLISALAQIPGNEKTFGKIYALTGDEALSLKSMSEILLKNNVPKNQESIIPVSKIPLSWKRGNEPKIYSIPNWVCLLAVLFFYLKKKLVGGRNPFTWQTYTGLIQNAELKDEQLRKDLDFHPRSFS